MLCVVGDVSFLHDTNGLAILNQRYDGRKKKKKKKKSLFCATETVQFFFTVFPLFVFYFSGINMLLNSFSFFKRVILSFISLGWHFFTLITVFFFLSSEGGYGFSPLKSALYGSLYYFFLHCTSIKNIFMLIV